MWKGKEPQYLPMQKYLSTAILELSGFPEASPSTREIFRELDIPSTTVRKVLRK